MWSLFCLSPLCLYLIGQQYGKQLLWTKQHSDVTCSPAVFPGQFFLFYPSKEIKEQYFHFALPPAVFVKMTERGRLSLFHKKARNSVSSSKTIIICTASFYCLTLRYWIRVEDLAAAVTPYWPFRAIKHTCPSRIPQAQSTNKQTMFFLVKYCWKVKSNLITKSI